MEKPARTLSTFERSLVAWVTFAIRRQGAVLLGCTLITLVLGGYAATHLGVNMDNKTTLLSPDLPFQDRARAFEAKFPLLNDSLLVVIDGESGEDAREGSRRLAEALSEKKDVAHSVFVADADPFFERHALLYRSVEDLESFSDQMVRFQPVLGELAQTPDLPTLTGMIERALGNATAAPPEELEPLLDHFGDATVSVFTEHPLRVSWQDLLLRESAFNAGKISTLIVDPVLDFDALLPAGRPIERIRAAGTELGIGPEQGLRLRITGYPALNDEEMRGLVFDVGVAGVFSFLIVLGVLGFAFRSGSMVAAAGITLIVGLIWTAAIAAAMVGRVNVVSIAFAVLFIGLGVDFAIHLGLHFLEGRRAGMSHEDAFADATADVGPALTLCSLTTAVGFFSFVPTDYLGVAELGLISGTGMFVILALTLTLFPALLTRRLPVGEVKRPAPTPSLAARLKPGWILVAALVAAILAIPGVQEARFDSNVVKMRNPNTESVQTWNDLLETGTGSPWYVDLLTPSLDAAEARGLELSELPEVSEVRTLVSFVPTEQEDKLMILEDLAFFLDVPKPTRAIKREAPTAEEQVAALRALHASLVSSELPDSGSFASSANMLRQRLDVFLERIDTEPDPAPILTSLEKSLLGRFPRQMERLQTALEPDPVELAVLPDRLRSRMLADDGSARLQVFPTADLNEDESMVSFVEAIQKVAPEATGLPVNLVEFGRATVASLRMALALAGCAIILLLLILWRRPVDAGLALAPLLLAGLWTIGAMGTLDVHFNFVNAVVLPLLLGMGVDSGVHLVRRARRGGDATQDLAATTTGRGVFLSAFTTLASFGSLASAAHLGVSSLGVVLVIGMAFTLLANLFVLPAWFAWRRDAAGASVGSVADSAPSSS